MITNLENPEIKEILKPYESDAAVSAILAEIKTSCVPYEIQVGTKGLDLTCKNEVKGVPNRACLKFYYPAEDTLLVFFYKRSNIPWSSDRFAYGGIEYGKKRHDMSGDEVRSLLEFAESGFSPPTRPEALIRLFPYDIPD